MKEDCGRQAALEDSQRYSGEVLLRNGTLIRFRPIRPDDAPKLFEMLQSLVTSSRYTRFTAPRSLSNSDAKAMCEIDHETSVALVAVVNKDSSQKIIGDARYVVDSSGVAAEGAVVVADEYQNRGVGTELVRQVVKIARARGLKKLYGFVSIDSRETMRVAEKLGFTIKTTISKGDYTQYFVELDLSPA